MFRARRRLSEVSRFIDENRGFFGVEPICRTWTCRRLPTTNAPTGQRSARTVGEARLLERIERLHAANYHPYGYRRTWKALRRQRVQVGRDRVKRLMRAHGIQWRQATRQSVAHHDRRPAAASGPQCSVCGRE